MRKRWQWVTGIASSGLAATWGWLTRNRVELTLTVALALIARGCWLAWRPAAYLVPGVVLLWIVLPSRTSFIVRLISRNGECASAPTERSTR